MKLTVDPQADALYLSLGEAEVVRTTEVAPGVLLDYDAEGRAVGVEILHLSKRAGKEDLQRMLFETVMGPAPS